MTIRFLAIVILVALWFELFAQKKSIEILGPPTVEEDSIASENYKCVQRNLYSVAKRLSFYPFNMSKKIVLISYNDTAELVNKTPISDRKIIPKTVIETVNINGNQVDTLTDILYNITSRPNDFHMQIADPGARCYQPRNSVVFLNAKDKVIGFIEICFECSRTQYSSRRIKRFQMCELRYDILKAFFISAVIKYGTTETEEED